jgi:6-phosphogluconolactonase
MIGEMLPLRFSAVGILLAGLLLALPVPILKHAPKSDYFLYVGSKSKQGIFLYKFDAVASTLGPGTQVASLPQITSFAEHPGSRFLYAATSKSSLAAYAIHPGDGTLRLLNTVEPQGKDACAVTAEKKGWMLMLSYCGSGGVESFRVAGDGGIGESTGLQKHESADAHPRLVAITPDNFFIFIPDMDKVFQYRFDPARAIFWPNDPATVATNAGAHPISLVFRPDEKFAYAADEAGSKVLTFTYNHDTGTLKLLDSASPLPAKPSSLAIDSAGRFLYAAGADAIAVLAIDKKKGTPMIVGRAPLAGKTPVQLCLDPTGAFLFAANSGSNRLSVFKINPKTGLLTDTSLAVEVPEPTAMQFVPVMPEGIH